MDNISINFALTIESIIAILGIVVTILIAAIGGIYAIITNTMKYELTENYRKELLQWYSTVVDLMIKLEGFIFQMSLKEIPLEAKNLLHIKDIDI